MTDGMKVRFAEFHKGREFVPGDGDTGADIVLIGEAPGKNEIAEGRPFVGKAGKNLDEFLSAVGIERNRVYITNAVKFRPVKVSPRGTVSNRTPSRDEIFAERALLMDEVREIGPSFVVTLGNTPLRSWLGDMRACIGDMHGRPFDTYGGMILFPLYHPASIIYNHALKDTYKEDLRVLAGLIKDARR